MAVSTSALDRSFVDRLLQHFDEHRRDMPWRRTADPYAIWISEVMLQQTRVDVVIPYYERWIARFPTVEHLAESDTEDVLRAWEGLGYYSRARNLHAAARIVREQHRGTLPDTVDGLRQLPGIGAYTAGAVSSIAYGRCEPAVDGNARRVFARLLDLEDDSIPAITRMVREVMPASRAGDFNQAVMELGATICTPRPSCDICPVREFCAAAANGTVAIRPGVTRRQKPPAFRYAVAVIVDHAGRTILSRRPDRGLLAGMWQFPAAEAAGRATTGAARKLVVELTSMRNLEPRALPPVVHQFTHRTETYHPFVFVLPESSAETQPVSATCEVPGVHEMRWVDHRELADLPMPAAQRRIAAAAGLHGPHSSGSGPA